MPRIQGDSPSFAYILPASSPTIAWQRVATGANPLAPRSHRMQRRAWLRNVVPSTLGRSDSPARLPAATVTRNARRDTTRSRCIYSFAAVNPFFHFQPGYRAVSGGCPRKFDEQQRITPDPNRIPKFPFKGSPSHGRLKFRRLVCEVTWCGLAKSCGNRKEERWKRERERAEGRTGRGSSRMEQVMVDGKGGRCSSEGTSPHSWSRGRKGRG